MDNQEKVIAKKWYNQDGSEIKRVIAVLLVVIIAAAGIIWYSSSMSMPGEVKLNSDISIEEADRLVQKAGYIPNGEIQSKEGFQYRYYESSKLYRNTTLGSAVGVATDPTKKAVIFAHLFEDENEQNNAENPGAVFMTVKKELSSRIGRRPGEITTKDGTLVWFWRRSETTQVSMRYKKDGAFEVRFEYFNP